MQFTRSQTDAHERIIGRFFMVRNDWTSSAARGMNYKGSNVSLEMNASPLILGSTQPGTGCSIYWASEYQPFTIGILLSDMIHGKDNLTGVWVNVLMYGPCDRIIVPSGGGNAGGFLVPSGLYNITRAVSVSTFDGMRKLQGTFTYTFGKTPTTGDTFKMDLSGSVTDNGTSGAATWSIAPGKLADATQLGGSIAWYKASYPVIGYHYWNDAEKDLEEADTISNYPYVPKRVQGFIKCLGTGGSGKG